MAGRQATGIPVTPGSGTVFADPGLPNPAVHLTWARLASEIRVSPLPGWTTGRSSLTATPASMR
jgi:hypothetical protein